MLQGYSPLSFFLLWYFSGAVLLLFIDNQSSVIQGIAISSAFLFLGSSSLLIVTSPQRVWAVWVTGAIAGMGAILIAGSAVAAPGIALSVTAGIMYFAAGIMFRAIICLNLSGTSLNQGSFNTILIFWIVLTVMGLVGLVAMLLLSNGAPIMLLFWGFTPWLVWRNTVELNNALSSILRQSPLSKLATFLTSIFLSGFIIISSSTITLSQGAIPWSIANIWLIFAVFVATLINTYCQRIYPDIQMEIRVNQRRKTAFWSVFLLLSLLLLGVQRYSTHFKQEVTLNERLSSLASPIFLQRMLDTQFRSYLVEISPDAQFLAVGGQLPKSYEQKVKLWNLKTGELIQSFPGLIPAFSEDSQGEPVLVIGLSKNEFKIWNLRTKKFQQGTPQEEALLQSQYARQTQEVVLPSFVPENGIFLASSSDGKILATGFDQKGLDDRILVWNRQTGRLICSLSSSNKFRSPPQYTVALSSDGRIMANITSLGDPPGKIYIWRLPEQ